MIFGPKRIQRTNEPWNNRFRFLPARFSNCQNLAPDSCQRRLPPRLCQPGDSVVRLEDFGAEGPLLCGKTPFLKKGMLKKPPGSTKKMPRFRVTNLFFTGGGIQFWFPSVSGLGLQDKTLEVILTDPEKQQPARKKHPEKCRKKAAHLVPIF